MYTFSLFARRDDGIVRPLFRCFIVNGVPRARQNDHFS
jgi:hypothetical protein